MLTAKTFQFLKDLAAHNDRDWFQSQKTRYEAARGEFEGFVDGLILSLGEIDSAVKGLTGKQCIFRIHRDTRFSKDKSPYKTHLGAHIGASAGPQTGSKSISKSEAIHSRAGYYVHIEPGHCMLGGGAYMPPAKWLASIRDAIDRDGASLQKILATASFKKWFGALEGESLKTAPKGYSPEHKHIDLLRRKSFLAIYRPSDAEVQKPNFAKQALAVFKALQPFNDFMNEAADG